MTPFDHPAKLVEFIHLTKSFGAKRVYADVNLDLMQGETLPLCQGSCRIRR